MKTPHEFFKEIYHSHRGFIPAIKAIRDQYGMSLIQAKEVCIQALGIASNLNEYQEGIADGLEEYYDSTSKDKS